MSKNKTKKASFRAFLGFVLGVATIIGGIVVLDMTKGSYADSATFGADFYTYSYRATRYAANNIYALADIVRTGLGFLLISLGGAEILFFTKFKSVKNENTAPQVAVPVAVPNVANTYAPNTYAPATYAPVSAAPVPTAPATYAPVSAAPAPTAPATYAPASAVPAPTAPAENAANSVGNAQV